MRRALRAAALAITPDQVATIIYTSGTTGEPKGVMLTHDNIYSNVSVGDRSAPDGPDDSSLSFLPLSHIFERMADYLMFAAGVSIAYAESMDTVPSEHAGGAADARRRRAAPLREDVRARARRTRCGRAEPRSDLFLGARGRRPVGDGEARRGASRAGCSRSQYAHRAEARVLEAARGRGGRLRYFVSGGAPLAPEINKFFYAAGLVILEGYGLTETSPVIAVNTPTRLRIGTVGEPIPGVEVKIAADGEILTRGPHVMKGYFNKPEATAEAIDADGWFHTGDIGELRGRVPAHHRSQEGHHRHRRRQEHRAAADREPGRRRTSTWRRRS